MIAEVECPTRRPDQARRYGIRVSVAASIDQWRADTHRAPFNLTINYVPQGSTFGRVQFGGGQFDYGASDIERLNASGVVACYGA